MSMLTLNNDCLASVTAVPDLFLEQYMPAANGEFVKVYLYLLKLVKDHQQDSTLSSMADFFSCTDSSRSPTPPGKAFRPESPFCRLSGRKKAESFQHRNPRFPARLRLHRLFLLYPLKSRRRNRPRLHHHSRPFLPHLPLLRQMIFPVPVFPDSQQKKNTLPAAAKNCSTFFTLRRRISVIFCRRRKSNASCFSMMISTFPRIFWNTWWNTVFRREAPASTT